MSTDASSDESILTRKWVRVLHIYISLYSLLLMLFFGVTGFMMNHPDWFGFGEIHTTNRELSVPTELCKNGDRLAIVEHLRAEEKIHGQVQACDVEEQSISVSFARAGRRTDITINRQTGKGTVTAEAKSLPAILSAVHAGEHTGRFGRRVIDVAAVFLILISVTGLALWCTLSIRRETGIMWLIASGIVLALITLKLIW